MLHFISATESPLARLFCHGVAGITEVGYDGFNAKGQESVDCLHSPLLQADDDPPLGFTQTFQLQNANGAFYCCNDIFMLALHNH